MKSIRHCSPWIVNLKFFETLILTILGFLKHSRTWKVRKARQQSFLLFLVFNSNIQANINMKSCVKHPCFYLFSEKTTMQLNSFWILGLKPKLINHSFYLVWKIFCYIQNFIFFCSEFHCLPYTDLTLILDTWLIYQALYQVLIGNFLSQVQLHSNSISYIMFEYSPIIHIQLLTFASSSEVPRIKSKSLNNILQEPL